MREAVNDSTRRENVLTRLRSCLSAFGEDGNRKRKRSAIFLEQTRRVIVSRMNTGPILKATLGKPPKDGVKRIRAFLSPQILS